MKKNFLLFSVLFALAFTSCSKNETPTPPQNEPAKGLYVLSEGSFGQNNSKLGLYNINNSQFTGNYFVQQNPSFPLGLGDTGNDLLLYGGKLYIVMNVSSYVMVVNPVNGKFIDSISFRTSAGLPKYPRNAAAYSNYIFVTSSDGTVSAIDTLSLAITHSIPVGINAEGIVAANNKLYVTNSGPFTAGYDSTVSIIDPVSFNETQRMVVGKNPVGITSDEAGNIYISCQGDYTTHGPKLVKLNTATLSITKIADTATSVIKYFNGYIYALGSYYGSPYPRKLSLTDFSAMSSNFITDGTVVVSPYNITIDPQSEDVYISDAKNYVSAGEVFCFDKTGKKKFSFSTSPGVSPSKIAFTR
ncbi:MAG: hypothetical protein IPL97_01135 [Niastella sp.]|nr:hypothetical protein [Niastella sp.]